MVRSTVTALRDHDPDTQHRFAAQCSRALARFPVPQLLRLKDTFATAATEAGLSKTDW
jgi:hypothetical protein